MRRLCEIAAKINNLNNYIDADWQKISKLNIASVCRLMSKFLHYIIQDTEEATAIMDRFRNIFNHVNLHINATKIEIVKFGCKSCTHYGVTAQRNIK